MYSIGYDIGSSSVKTALIDVISQKVVAVKSYPDHEMEIKSQKQGWAEQDPESWWNAVCITTKEILTKHNIDAKSVKSIGVSYQMHGLVVVDENRNVLRDSIIWCDSRAVDIGNKALEELGEEYCYGHMLNSPGNFTASKLKWVKENESDVFKSIHKFMLPGDYIAMKLSGDISTTVTGLSEGILWDFENNKLATGVLDHYEVDKELVAEVVDNFSIQSRVSDQAAMMTGLSKGTPITYRAGDQPNNAMSLNVLEPGEVAATGGTSGVIYGVSDRVAYDRQARVNAFAHVNHSTEMNRIGQLLCINGAGSQYAWIKKQMAEENTSYSDMEKSLSQIKVGSEGLRILPFGNGAERMLSNAKLGAQFNNVQFNIHGRTHFYRAALEGIAFSFVHGIEALNELGIEASVIRVGNDNLFQSEVFASTIATLLDCEIQMIDTTGAVGAAYASAIAVGGFDTLSEAMNNGKLLKSYHSKKQIDPYRMAYKSWCQDLVRLLEV